MYRTRRGSNPPTTGDAEAQDWSFDVPVATGETNTDDMEGATMAFYRKVGASLYKGTDLVVEDAGTPYKATKMYVKDGASLYKFFELGDQRHGYAAECCLRAYYRFRGLFTLIGPVRASGSYPKPWEPHVSVKR